MKIAVSALLVSILVGAALAEEANLTLTVDGVTYSNVTFGTVTPIKVSIRHRTGATTLPLEKLPPDLQQRFGYNLTNAAAYEQKLADAQAARAALLKKQAEEARQAAAAAEAKRKADAAAEEKYRREHTVTIEQPPPTTGGFEAPNGNRW